nr:MAG TPA: hypothetical protein [Caudoviricetes sp.]
MAEPKGDPAVVSGRFRSFFRSFQVIPGHFPIDSGKSFLFIPFRSSFLPKTTENSPKSQSLEEKYDYFLNFPRFYLAVPDFLLTFAIAKQDDSNLSGRATVSPMASQPQAFFMPKKYHFPGNGKKVYRYGGCMNRKI